MSHRVVHLQASESRAVTEPPAWVMAPTIKQKGPTASNHMHSPPVVERYHVQQALTQADLPALLTIDWAGLRSRRETTQ